MSVEAGEGFAIFLTDDGKVYQTGDNYFSPSYRAEYDDETDYEYAEYVAQPTFTLVNTGSHTIEKISVYDNTAYALDSDGRLHMWGSIYRATNLPFENGLLDPQYDENRQMIIGAFPPAMTYVGPELIYSHPSVSFDDVKVGYDHVLLRAGNNMYSIGSTQFSQARLQSNNVNITTAFASTVKSHDFSMSAGYQVSVYIGTDGQAFPLGLQM